MSGERRELALAASRHAELANLVDDLSLVEAYLEDALDTGGDDGYSLTPGSLSARGSAGFFAYFPAADPEQQSDATTNLISTLSQVLDGCVAEGTPFTIPSGC